MGTERQTNVIINNKCTFCMLGTRGMEHRIQGHRSDSYCQNGHGGGLQSGSGSPRSHGGAGSPGGHGGSGDSGGHGGSASEAVAPAPSPEVQAQLSAFEGPALECALG